MNIEENIKKLKCRFLNINWLYGNRVALTKAQYEDIKLLINNILLEREESKKELEKKNMIIYILEEQLVGLTVLNDKEEVIILKNKEEVKKHFERKVEDD